MRGVSWSGLEVWSWCARCLLGALVVLLVGAWPRVAAAEPLDGMPTPAKVQGEIRGADAVDTAARRSAAFRILRTMIRDAAGPRGFSASYTARESELLGSYTNAESQAASQGLALLRQQGGPTSGFDSPSPRWTRLFNKYEYDRDLRAKVDALLPAEFRDHYRQSTQAQAAPRGGPQAARTDEDGLINWGPLFEGLFERARNDPLGAIIALVMALMMLSYPLLAVVRSVRVKLWSSSGVARQPNTSVETYSSHTTGHYNAATGHYSPGSTTVTSHRYDEFFLVGAQRETRVMLANAYFPVRDGQQVTVVWSNGWPCHVRNHNTRESRNLYSGVRRARGHTVPVALVWTLLLLGAGYVLSLMYLGGSPSLVPGQPSWEPMVALFATLGITFWVSGGMLMRIVHIFGDYRLLSRARQLGQSAR